MNISITELVDPYNLIKVIFRYLDFRLPLLIYEFFQHFFDFGQPINFIFMQITQDILLILFLILPLLLCLVLRISKYCFLIIAFLNFLQITLPF